MRRFSIAMVLFCSCSASQPDSGKQNLPKSATNDGHLVRSETKQLDGAWIEAHALTKEKSKGRGSYYVWYFQVDRVVRKHTETEDGEPIIGSSHSGTYKADNSVTPHVIDIVLKSPAGEDWKYFGIYEFDAESLKMCLGQENRPTSFDRDSGNSLYLLKRLPMD